jgi:hypothetical protein
VATITGDVIFVVAALARLHDTIATHDAARLKHPPLIDRGVGPMSEAQRPIGIEFDTRP